MTSKHIPIAVIMDGVGGTNWGWRRKDVRLDASVSIENYIEEAKIAEAAKMDFIFIADTMHITSGSSPHFLNRFEPISLLSAIASHTSNIGLIATLSTSYTEPFTAARQLASLDMISHGRAGWNIVTSALEGAARNHSRDGLDPLEDRYARAAEHVAVCQGLWDSWEDDAFVRDRENGVFFREDRLHALMHKGKYFRADGPLNIARSPQGHPVLFQAGASSDGRNLAAAISDCVFGGGRTKEEAAEYSRDVWNRAEALGRSRSDIRFFHRIEPIVGETLEEAERKYEEASALVSYEEALKWLSFFFSYQDFTKFDPDAKFPLEELGETGRNNYRSTTDRIKWLSEDGTLTLREVARKFAIPRSDFIGSADMVADACERWVEEGVCDGFMLGCTVSRFTDFTRLVIPMLQERGRFRTDYDGSTLRDNLGFAKKPNRYTVDREARDMAT